jgi:hypothetical protein
MKKNKKKNIKKAEKVVQTNIEVVRLTIDENLERYFTACEISAQYDVITFEFHLFTDSFDLPRRNRKEELGTKGYEFLRHRVKPAPADKLYLPSWNISYYRNLKTGNLIICKVSSNLPNKSKLPLFMVKIEFHNESSPLTTIEINHFLDFMKSCYRNFLDGLRHSSISDYRILIVPVPYVSKVEIALDFKGDNIRFLHENIRDSLHKMRARIKDDYSDEEQVKPRYTFNGRILYGFNPTHYISNVFRDYLYEDREGNEIYRCEIVLTKSYLQKNHIRTAQDIENFDRTKYWTDNYFFFTFDKERILSYVSKKKPEWLRIMAILLDSDQLYNPSEIYEKLKTDYKIIGALDFSVEEFTNGFTIKGLCNALKRDGVTLNDYTVASLNGLLEQSDFYENLINSRKDKKASRKLKKLITKYKVDPSKFNLKNVNRLVLEEYYPKEAPKGKSLFGYPSRLLTTKWKKFDGMIQNALSKLTLSGKPVAETFTPIERKRDKAPAKRGRKSREQDILRAIESLRRKGIKVTYKAIATEAKITEKSIAKYKHLLKS